MKKKTARAKGNPCLSSTIGRRNISRIFLLHDVDGIAIGMAYFRGRGFRDDIIINSSWVLPPKRTALAEAAKAAGYNPKYLVDTGLCFKVDKDEAGNKSGRIRFWTVSGRAIFPWFSVSGKVVTLADECSTAEPRASARNTSTRPIALSIIRSANSMDSIRPRRR